LPEKAVYHAVIRLASAEHASCMFLEPRWDGVTVTCRWQLWWVTQNGASTRLSQDDFCSQSQLEMLLHGFW